MESEVPLLVWFGHVLYRESFSYYRVNMVVNRPKNTEVLMSHSCVDSPLALPLRFVRSREATRERPPNHTIPGGSVIQESSRVQRAACDWLFDEKDKVFFLGGKKCVGFYCY